MPFEFAMMLALKNGEPKLAVEKAIPTFKALLIPFTSISFPKTQALFVAIRWDEHPERAKETYFSPRIDPEHIRVHPMLHFTWLDVWQYIKQFNVPFNPLYLKGYTSLGCKPCTSKVKKDGFRDIDEIIAFIKQGKAKERAGRDIDKELVMERLRKLGYY